MTLPDLNEAEDELDEEDERAIEIYRQQRIREWKSLHKSQVFGELMEIAGDQYVKEVTNAKEDIWVVIHLYRSGIEMCSLLDQYLSLLARKFPETKFLKANANSCIQNYHDRYLPTIVVYKNGQIMCKFIGIDECGGENVKLQDLKRKLVEVGAINSNLEEDNTKKIEDMMTSSIRTNSMPSGEGGTSFDDVD